MRSRLEYEGIDWRELKKTATIPKIATESVARAVEDWHSGKARSRAGYMDRFRSGLSRLYSKFRRTAGYEAKKAKRRGSAVDRVFSGRLAGAMRTARVTRSHKTGMVTLKVNWPPHLKVTGGRSKRTDAASVSRNRLLDLRAECEMVLARDSEAIGASAQEHTAGLFEAADSPFRKKIRRRIS